MRGLIFALALATGLTASAQTDTRIPHPDYFDYLTKVFAREPMKGPTIEERSIRVGGIDYRAEGDAKFLKIPAKFGEFWVAAVGEGDAAIITNHPMTYLMIQYQRFDKQGNGKILLRSTDIKCERIMEGEKHVGYRTVKPGEGQGWFLVTKEIINADKVPLLGSPAALSLTAFFAATKDVEDRNPEKAPTLDDDLIVIEGTKLKVDGPVKFMRSTEAPEDFWIAPSSRGKAGAVLVNSERWQVGFLPFKEGKVHASTVEPLKGEPIVVNGITVGWRFAKPEPSAGWFLSLGLVPQQPAEPAPKDANAP